MGLGQQKPMMSKRCQKSVTPQWTHGQHPCWEKAHHRLPGLAIQHKLRGQGRRCVVCTRKVHISVHQIPLRYFTLCPSNVKALCPKDEKKKITCKLWEHFVMWNMVVYEISHVNCETKVKVLFVPCQCLGKKKEWKEKEWHTFKDRNWKEENKYEYRPAGSLPDTMPIAQTFHAQHFSRPRASVRDYI